MDGEPKNLTSLDSKYLEETIGSFVDEYMMVEFDVEKALRQQKEQANQQSLQEGNRIL